MAIEEILYQKGFTTSANINAGLKSQEKFITEDEQYQFAPFDTILISNSDAIHLTILLDGIIPIPCQPNSIVTANKIKFRDIVIRNDDAAVAHTAGTVDIVVEKHRGI